VQQWQPTDELATFNGALSAGWMILDQTDC
jgi:hypothetical protein